MKKVIILIIFSCFFLEGNAQFFRGVGIFVGPNSTAHRYRNLRQSQKDPAVFDPELYYPQSHYSRDFQAYAVGIFAEFLRYDHLRWQTEIEYTMKGAMEKEIIDQYLGTRAGGFVPNTYQYIQWNNYLKFMGRVEKKRQSYAMIGAKIEYCLSRATPVFAPISGTFPLIWVSGDVGVGYEFFTWKRLHPFVELHYNPDLFYQPPRAGTTVRSRTIELRIGLIFRPMAKSIDDCNAPTYHGNYY
jgi:hypothetical protein